MTDVVRINYLKSACCNSCLLTPEQLRYYNIPQEAETITLSTGLLSVNLKILISFNKRIALDELHLTEDVQDYFPIPEGSLLQVKRSGDLHFELGPLIGVFVNQKNINDLLAQKGATAYSHFDTACKSLYGLCCFFSIHDIDWRNDFVEGIVRRYGKWRRYLLPLPKVIYDRNVESKCRVESIELRKRLKHKCHILNAMPKLAKWETIQALKKNPKLWGIIPDTVWYNNSSDIANMLEKYQHIYLKPDSLSKGKGIFRISRTEDGQYQVEYREPEVNRSFVISTLDELDKYLTQYAEKGGGYVIQEEISKALYRGNPFDFRLLYQKDWQGCWQPSGIAGRISAEGSIITSPRSGGSVERLPNILQETFNEDEFTEGGLYESIISIGREIAKTIENEFGDCVELGLDMTIDTNRRIWVIEVNGKPLKVSLKRLNSPAVVLQCDKRPIEYAVRLAGFKSADTALGGLYRYYT